MKGHILKTYITCSPPIPATTTTAISAANNINPSLLDGSYVSKPLTAQPIPSLKPVMSPIEPINDSACLEVALEDQVVQLKEQIQPMHQDFNKKHHDLLARLRARGGVLGEMLIDVIETRHVNLSEFDTNRLSVDSSDTIDAVKMKIHQRTGIAPDQQTLVYVGESLVDGDRTLADYDIQSGSKIILRYKVPAIRCC